MNNLYNINKIALEYFTKNIDEESAEEARKLLARKGIPNPIKYSIGYASFGDALINKMREKNFSNCELISSGLFEMDSKGNLKDIFVNRVMLPIFDVEEHIASFIGLAVDDTNPVYLFAKETDIYKKEEILCFENIAKRKKKDYLILVEGYVEALNLISSGIENCVATLCKELSIQKIRTIRKLTNRVVICYDSDELGNRTAIRDRKILTENGISAYQVNLSDCCDVAEFIARYDAGDFVNLIEKIMESN